MPRLAPASMTPEQRHAQRLAYLGDRYDHTETLGQHGLLATGTYTAAGAPRYLLAAFAGKACKPLRRFYCYFRDPASRAASIERLKASEAAAVAARVQRRAERSQPHALQLGDVLASSWGYEQTNVDFYEVVAVRGRVVDLRELAQDKTRDSDMTGYAMPIKGEYIGDVLRSKRPNSSNAVRLTSFSYARPWDGRPQRWTSYA